MKEKTYRKWINKRVRRRGESVVGTVVAPAKYNTWWVVEWPDGKRSQLPERDFEEAPADAPCPGEELLS